MCHSNTVLASSLRLASGWLCGDSFQFSFQLSHMLNKIISERSMMRLFLSLQIQKCNGESFWVSLCVYTCMHMCMYICVCVCRTFGRVFLTVYKQQSGLRDFKIIPLTRFEIFTNSSLEEFEGNFFTLSRQQCCSEHLSSDLSVHVSPCGECKFAADS